MRLQGFSAYRRNSTRNAENIIREYGIFRSREPGKKPSETRAIHLTSPRAAERFIPVDAEANRHRPDLPADFSIPAVEGESAKPSAKKRK